MDDEDLCQKATCERKDDAFGRDSNGGLNQERVMAPQEGLDHTLPKKNL